MLRFENGAIFLWLRFLGTLRWKPRGLEVGDSKVIENPCCRALASIPESDCCESTSMLERQRTRNKRKHCSRKKKRECVSKRERESKKERRKKRKKQRQIKYDNNSYKRRTERNLYKTTIRRKMKERNLNEWIEGEYTYNEEDME